MPYKSRLSVKERSDVFSGNVIKFLKTFHFSISVGYVSVSKMQKMLVEKIDLNLLDFIIFSI